MLALFERFVSLLLREALILTFRSLVKLLQFWTTSGSVAALSVGFQQRSSFKHLFETFVVGFQFTIGFEKVLLSSRDSTVS